LSRSEAAQRAEPSRRTLTVGIVGVVSLVAFEAMAVATAMPVAVKELDALPQYGWAFSAFLVSFLFSTVVAGQLSDQRGPRLPLLGGIGFFGAGLLVAGLAPDMAVFVLGRFLQGLGAGGLIVSVYVVVGRAYTEARRPQVFALLSAAWVVPSIVGPPVAGFLADNASWRWVFLGVLVVAAPIVALVVPSLAGVGGAVGTPARRASTWAALGTASAVALLQYAGTRHDLLSVGIALLALGLLVPTAPRLLPHGTLRAGRGLPTTVLMRGVLAAAFFGAETFLPLGLVNERQLSTTLAGMTLTGAALGWSTGSWLQGHPARERPRWQLVQFGCVLVAVGNVVAGVVITTGLPVAIAAVGWTLGGLGMGLGMASVSVRSLELAPVEDHGFTSSALQVCDGMLSTIAIVAASTLFAAWHTAPGQDSDVFAVIYAVMAAIAVLGALVAPRMRPARTPVLADS
jgi:MFS family permease